MSNNIIAMLAPSGFTGSISCTGGTPPLSGQTYTPDSDGLITADPADVSALLRSGFTFASASGTNANRINTAVTTVGAATLAAAAVIGGVITRSGSVAAYSDTLPTAAAIIAALVDPAVGSSWVLEVKNTVPFAQTILTGTGITLSGQAVIAPNSVGRFLVTVTGAATMTAVGLGSVPIANLPGSQYSTAALQSAPIPAANMAGAQSVSFENTGTTPGTLTTDTAAAIVAAIPNAQVGMAYDLYVRNSSGSANTATVAGGTGVTTHGTMTIAQNVTRRFVVVLTSLTAVDLYSMGVSAAAL